MLGKREGTRRRGLRLAFALAAALAMLLGAAPAAPAAFDFLAKWGSFGTGDGQLDSPRGLATDAAGNVYVADPFNRRIQKFTPAGAFLAKWGSLGTGDGQFDQPSGVATDAAGNVYVADTVNNRIQKFTPAGAFVSAWGWGVTDGNSAFQVCTTTCLAGSPGTGDGQLSGPLGLATDAAGNVYVADSVNNRIQKFTPAGAFLAKWGSPGTGDGQLGSPWALATDCRANVYVADTGHNRIQKFGETTAPPPPCPAASPPDTTAPLVTAAGASPKTFAVDKKGPAEVGVAKKKRKAKRGTTFAYALTEAARVVFTIERKSSGRKVKGKCVRKTRKNRKRRKCTRYKLAGRFAQQGAKGKNTKKFSGKIARKKLKPGSYRATLVAKDAAGNASKPAQVSFKVVRR